MSNIHNPSLGSESIRPFFPRSVGLGLTDSCTNGALQREPSVDCQLIPMQYFHFIVFHRSGMPEVLDEISKRSTQKTPTPPRDSLPNRKIYV